MWTEYTWIVVTGCLAAFFTAYGIGANDVANAFGSSVAARTLTMRQALVIASVCEFSGSVLLGGEVTRTVASGIAKLSYFDRQPELYMYGMLCALVSSGTWLLVATYLELPVSTTHSIAGAVLGFAFVAGGPKAVVWLEPQDEFPYMKGMVPIVVSWFISPLISGLASALFFLLVRTAVLRRYNSLELAFWALPILVVFTVFINVFFVIHKGADTRVVWSASRSAWVAACAAGGSGLLTVLVGMPLVRQYVYKDLAARRRHQLAEMETQVKLPEGHARAPTASGGGGPTANGSGSYNRSGGGGGGVVTAAAPSASRLSAGSLHHTASGLGSRSLNAVASTAVVTGGGGSGRMSTATVSRPQTSASGMAGTAGGAVGSVSVDSASGRGLANGAQAPGFVSPFIEYGTTGSGRRVLAPRGVSPPAQGGSPPSLPPLPPRGSAAPPFQPSPPRGRSPGTSDGGDAAAAAPSGPAAVLIHAESIGTLPAVSPTGHHFQRWHQGLPQQAEQAHDAALLGGPDDCTGDSPAGRGASNAPAPATTSSRHARAGSGDQDSATPEGRGDDNTAAAAAEAAAVGEGRESADAVAGAVASPAVQSQPMPLHQSQALLQQQQQQYWVPSPHLGLLQQGQQMMDSGQVYPGYWVAQPQQQQQQWGIAEQQQYLLLQQQQQNYVMMQQQAQYQQQLHLFQQQQQHLGGVWQGPAGGLQESNYQHQLQLHAISGAESSWRGGGGQIAGSPTYGGGGAPAGRQRPPALNLSRPGPIAESTEWGGNKAAAAATARDEAVYANGHGGPRCDSALAATAGVDGPDGVAAGGNDGENIHWQSTFDQLKAIVLRGTNVDVHEAIVTDQAAQRIHMHAEVFDPATEHAFKYLQVITAICDSFSHGANDVANSVGPFTAIWYIYRNYRVDYMADLPIWILAIGGAGIVVGLATYGYNIIRAIGVRLSVITPSRGFCIELSTALVVALASSYGLPISTTHCQVGATAAMGLMEGAPGLHWRLVVQFFLGWVFTLVLTGLLSAALFASGAYAPSVQQGRAIVRYEDALLQLTAKLDLLLNRTNAAALADPATWGNFSSQLNTSLSQSLAWVQTASAPGGPTATRPVQEIDAAQLTAFLNTAVATYANNSLPYIGGMAAKGQALPKRP